MVSAETASAAFAAPAAAPAHGAPVAPYARVKRHLKHGLATGRWPPGALMPSEAELVAEFGVSRMTVSRALRELQAEGLVARSQGVGTFAAPLHRVSSTLTIRDLHEEIAARGHQHHATVHLQRAERASAALAAQLGVAAGARVFHTLIVHHENGVPLQCEDRYVNPACAPDYLGVDFTQTTPTRHLFEATALWRAQYSIEAARPTAQEARLMSIADDEPCLIVVRRTFTRSAPITIARLVHPGSRYQLEGQFTP
jgi:GntR family histidine utilization transcriptional repressor